MKAEEIYKEYIDQVGELIKGTVQRFERGDIIVTLSKRTEAIIPRSQQARHEKFSQGDTIKTVIINVYKEPGYQVVLSRTSPQLLSKLFEEEVPEIKAGQVTIKSAVREPGDLAKIAVNGTNAVEVCTGTKGSHLQSVMNELREKIDIVLWSDDPKVFVTKALTPAVIKQINMTDRDGRHEMEVLVADDQLSAAIGKRGTNVRLAMALTGCRIDVKSESDK